MELEYSSRSVSRVLLDICEKEQRSITGTITRRNNRKVRIIRSSYTNSGRGGAIFESSIGCEVAVEVNDFPCERMGTPV
jgi:hypothetical protein